MYGFDYPFLSVDIERNIWRPVPNRIKIFFRGPTIPQNLEKNLMFQCWYLAPF